MRSSNDDENGPWESCKLTDSLDSNPAHRAHHHPPHPPVTPRLSVAHPWSGAQCPMFQQLRQRELTGRVQQFRKRLNPGLDLEGVLYDHLSCSSSSNSHEVSSGIDGGSGSYDLSENASWITPVFSVDFSQTHCEGHFLSVSDEGGRLAFFDIRLDADTFQEADTTVSWQAHMDSILDHRWAGPGDAWVVTASGDRTAKVWDLETQACLATFQGHSGGVKTVRPAPDHSNLFVTASRDGSVRLWDSRVSCDAMSRGHTVTSRAAVLTLQAVHSVYSPILSSARKKPVRQPAVAGDPWSWSAAVANGEVQEANGSVSLSRSNSSGGGASSPSLLTASDNNAPVHCVQTFGHRCWYDDARFFLPRKRRRVSHDRRSSSAGRTEDEDERLPHSLRREQKAAQQIRELLSGEQSPVWRRGVPPSSRSPRKRSRSMASTSSSSPGAVGHLLSNKGMAPGFRFTSKRAVSVTCVEFIPGTQTLASAGAAESVVKLWDLRSLRPSDGVQWGRGAARSSHPSPKSTPPRRGLRRSPRRRHIRAASSDDDDGLGEESPSPPPRICRQNPSPQPMTHGVVPLAVLGDCQSRLSSRQYGVTSLDVHPNGLSIISSCGDSTVRMFSLCGKPSPAPVQEFRGHSLNSYYVKSRFSPDGRYIASGSSDHHVYIWDTNTPRRSPRRLAGHGREANSVAWCATSSPLLVSCSDDGTVKRWTLERPEQFTASSATSPSFLSTPGQVDGEVSPLRRRRRVRSSRDRSDTVDGAAETGAVRPPRPVLV